MTDPLPIAEAERFEEALSLQRLVQESRCRLGPSADVLAVVADLQDRGIEIDCEDVIRVWDDGI